MDETISASSVLVPSIHRLSDAVINRIAAGEVVQRPCSAIKELIENSIDAKAKNIVITVRGGGLHLLQIQDDGHGIRKEDLGILCERFTTSKLTTFEDLKTIQTYGFRGEALSSITHVANVTITTKTHDSICAFKTEYSDGKMKSEPKPIAGITGTTVSVEDLFYNLPTRKQAFKNASEQYNRILDVVVRYSIHHGNNHVAFTCKRVGQTSPDYQTLSSQENSTNESIRVAYGAAVVKDLTSISSEFTLTSSVESLELSIPTSALVKIEGKISSVNYCSKKVNTIIFINDRLVECQSIRKVIDVVYASLLPKNSHPFVYLSITMPPQFVDVNIHPTKKEVRFLFEDEILTRLHETMSSTLSCSNVSRVFSVQPASTLLMPLSTYDKEPLNQVDSQSSQRMSKSKDILTTMNPSHYDQLVYNLSTTHSKDEVIGHLNDSHRLEQSFQDDRKRPVEPNESQFDYDQLLRPLDNSYDSGSINSSANKMKATENKSIHLSKANKKQKISENKLVRVDHKSQKIDSFFVRRGHESFNVDNDVVDESLDSPRDCMTSLPREEFTRSANDDIAATVDDVTLPQDPNEFCQFIETDHISRKFPSKDLSYQSRNCSSGCDCCVDDGLSIGRPRDHEQLRRDYPTILNYQQTSCQYTSIQELIQEIKCSRYLPYTTILRQHVFVGTMSGLSIVQHQTQLFLVNHDHLIKHLFYQLVLDRFQCLPRYSLSKPLSLRELITSIENLDVDPSSTRRTQSDIDDVVNLLKSKAAMLSDYFSIDIDDSGNLTALPAILPVTYSRYSYDDDLKDCVTYFPSTAHLPLFLYRLAMRVQWNHEKSCFRSISQELALYYSILPESANSLNADKILNDNNSSMNQNLVGSVFYPLFVKYLIVPRQCVEDKTFRPLTSLESLYKVFERC